MSYCINPKCQNPRNEEGVSSCVNCGVFLLLGDRYRALKLIGQGGFGRTFLAVDESLATKPRCVIKQFLPPNISTSAASELFREEAERLKSLGSHPQIPTFLDYLEINEQRYIIQEFIDGSNLEQELEETGAFDEDQIRQLLNDILPVLEFVHDHSVIHRDIKPENIIRRASDRRLALVDFGAAKYAATGTALIKTGTTIGSAGYTAPEQLMGKAVFQSDLYSLGVTCVHLLTQVPPFDLVDSAEGSWVWRDYLSDPVSKQLGSILDKLLERGTRKRYNSVRAVLHDLALPQLHNILDDISSTELSNLIKKGESQSLKSKFVVTTIGGIVGISAFAGMGYVAIHISDLVNPPIIIQAPQPQSRLTPDPQITPLPNSRPSLQFSDGKPIELMSPVVRSFTIIFATLSVIMGVGIGFLDYQHRGDYQRGLNIMMAGLLMSIATNIFWNSFIAPPATTSIAPIHHITKVQSFFDK